MRFSGAMVALAVLAIGCGGEEARTESAAPPSPSASAVEALPSWSAGATRDAILDFVERTTTEGSADFVPESERIAVFDNDGTLWAEQPLYFQLAFAIDRARELSSSNPALAENALVRALASGDSAALAEVSEHDLLEVVSETHSGLTVEAFQELVADWLASARHPRFDRPYSELVYRPMLELLDLLRANGFKTFIVSGGGVDFMRVFAEEVYGIPPEQIMGSMGKARFELGEGSAEIVKEPGVDFIDDKEGKPVGIARFIGRRPIFAFGNSDGDLAMLQYTMGGTGARFAGIVHHDDSEREWAYDRESKIGRLDTALDQAERNGWTVVSIAKDWNEVFPGTELP